MVCGKLTSQLGEVPIDEQNNVPAYVYRQESTQISKIFHKIYDQFFMKNYDVETGSKCQPRRVAVSDLFDEYPSWMSGKSANGENLDGVHRETRPEVWGWTFYTRGGKFENII